MRPPFIEIEIENSAQCVDVLGHIFYFTSFALSD